MKIVMKMIIASNDVDDDKDNTMVIMEMLKMIICMNSY